MPGRPVSRVACTLLKLPGLGEQRLCPEAVVCKDTGIWVLEVMWWGQVALSLVWLGLVGGAAM